MDLTTLLPRSSARVTLRPLRHEDAGPYADGTAGAGPISTFDGDPTCVTTIELT